MRTKTPIFTAIAGILLCAGAAPQAMGHSILGSAWNFSVLGGSTVTNTGSTVLTGDLGVWPGTSATGFPPGIVQGAQHIGNATAQQAQADALTAYNDLAGRAPTQDLTGQDLGGLTLTPGVYSFSSSAFLTGTLTLDAQGDPNAQFIFQMGSTLISASDSSVVGINGASGCDVFWQVGSSATLGTNTDFMGYIVANTSITMTTGASIFGGSALALNGAVTLDNNFIDSLVCIPLPSGAGLAGLGLGLVALRRRR
ncbi:MAG: DUF3494 domain-containing protein [Phycisphaerales bacterium]|nr:DUF3494 domain-containing protein [Phycisphaerales bacterium]